MYYKLFYTNIGMYYRSNLLIHIDIVRLGIERGLNTSIYIKSRETNGYTHVFFPCRF